MLNPYNTNTRKYPYGPKVINPHSLNITDITGSLLGIEEPEKYKVVSTKKSPYSISVSNDRIKTLETGSLAGIVEPTKKTISENLRAPQSEKVTNLHKIQTERNKDLLRFSGKQIEKQISSYDSMLNCLYISSSFIDESVQTISRNDFEVYYNGMLAPDIFTIEQSGSFVVIKFEEPYINYEILQTSEVLVIGKFV